MYVVTCNRPCGATVSTIGQRTRPGPTGPNSTTAGWNGRSKTDKVHSKSTCSFLFTQIKALDAILATYTQEIDAMAARQGLLRDMSTLILDEPTAALDPGTERALIAALNAVKQDRIIIVIAHRLSTISNADRILFMAEGRITEQGSNDELMAKTDGDYRHFVDLQTGDVLPEWKLVLPPVCQIGDDQHPPTLLAPRFHR
jgi:ABC-type antimicrobial peptide transport system ATPase subunit